MQGVRFQENKKEMSLKLYNRLEEKLETLVANQFEEPRIQSVVNSVATERAEALLLEQINPVVDKFMAEMTSKLQKIETIVASMQESKSQSDSNAKQIEKALAFTRNSQQEIEKFKKSISGLQSDLIKINRGIVEIQYYTYISRGRFGNNPYQERIEQKMNELIKIAVPDPQERSKFVNELKAYRPDE